MKIDPELLQILVCPACKSEVQLRAETLVCRNTLCGLKYPVKEGIPVMLIEEAAKD